LGHWFCTAKQQCERGVACDDPTRDSQCIVMAADRRAIDGLCATSFMTSFMPEFCFARTSQCTICTDDDGAGAAAPLRDHELLGASVNAKTECKEAVTAQCDVMKNMALEYHRLGPEIAAAQKQLQAKKNRLCVVETKILETFLAACTNTDQGALMPDAKTPLVLSFTLGYNWSTGKFLSFEQRVIRIISYLGILHNTEYAAEISLDDCYRHIAQDGLERMVTLQNPPKKTAHVRLDYPSLDSVVLGCLTLKPCVFPVALAFYQQGMCVTSP